MDHEDTLRRQPATRAAKDAQRAEIDKDVQAFLKAGNKITKVPMGDGVYKPVRKGRHQLVLNPRNPKPITEGSNT